MNDYQACYRQIEGLYQDTAIRDRRYYPDFRRSWDALLRRADGIVLADGVSVNGTALGTVTDGTLLLERLYEAMRGDMPETATVARLGGNLQIHRVYSRAGHESPVWDMVLRVTGAAPVFYLDGEGKVV